MRPRRPTSVLVLAIFHFVLGGLGILGALGTIAATAVVYALPKTPTPATTGGPAFSPFAQYQYLDVHLPYWKEVDIAFGALYLVISVFMVVAGVGLVQMKPWGRTLSLVYAVVSILSQTLRLIYTVGALMPAMMGFYESMPSAPPGVAVGAKFGLVVGVGVIVLGLVYPIIVLIVLLRPSIAAAFRGEALGPDAPGDPYDRRPRDDDSGRYPPGYGQEPPGPGDEPDDRFGPGQPQR